LEGAGLTLPYVPGWAQPVHHLFVVRSRKRDALRQHLQEAGIGTLIHYPVPPHLQKAYRDLGLGLGSQPIAERIHEEVVSLPMGPQLTEAQVAAVIDAVREFAQ
jgi:dTDP-4-amino-4,6-dideoxygalactose transaminase